MDLYKINLIIIIYGCSLYESRNTPAHSITNTLTTSAVNFTTLAPTESDNIPGDNNDQQQNSEHNILTDIQNGIRKTINKAMDQMEDIKNKTDKTVDTIQTLEDELSQHKSNLQNLETKFENVKEVLSDEVMRQKQTLTERKGNTTDEDMSVLRAEIRTLGQMKWEFEMDVPFIRELKDPDCPRMFHIGKPYKPLVLDSKVLTPDTMALIIEARNKVKMVTNNTIHDVHLLRNEAKHILPRIKSLKAQIMHLKAYKPVIEEMFLSYIVELKYELNKHKDKIITQMKSADNYEQKLKFQNELKRVDIYLWRADDLEQQVLYWGINDNYSLGACNQGSGDGYGKHNMERYEKQINNDD